MKSASAINKSCTGQCVSQLQKKSRRQFCFSLSYVPPVIQHNVCRIVQEKQFSYHKMCKSDDLQSEATMEIKTYLCGNGERNRTRGDKGTTMIYTI